MRITNQENAPAFDIPMKSFLLRNPLQDFRAYIEKKLSPTVPFSVLPENDAKLRKSLYHLTDEQKTRLTYALISQDYDSVAHILAASLFITVLERRTRFSVQHIFGFFEEYAATLNPNNATPVLRLPNEFELLFLQNMFPQPTSSAELIKFSILINRAMRKIPDEKLSFLQKNKYAETIQGVFKKTCSKGAYHAELPSQQISLPQGKITLKEYEVVTAYADISAWIILSIGLFQTQMTQKFLAEESKQAIQSTLDIIKNDYAFINYNSAIEQLDELAKHPFWESGTLKIYTKTQAICIRHISAESNPRRFFETRLTQFYFGRTTLHYETLNTISNHFLGLTAEFGSSQDCEDILLQLMEMARLNSRVKSYHDEILSQLSGNKTSENKVNLGKETKPGIVRRAVELQTEKLGESIFSNNTGILKSNSPVLFAKTSEHLARNRITDIFSTPTDSTSFSYTHPTIPMVGSWSGHAAAAIALLRVYMEAKKYSEQSKRLASPFLTALTTVYLKHGFHSIGEMYDIFTDPAVKKFFTDNNVEINLGWWRNNEILIHAFNDTITYCKALGSQTTLHADLLLRYHDPSSTPSGNKKYQFEPKFF